MIQRLIGQQWCPFCLPEISNKCCWKICLGALYRLALSKKSSVKTQLSILTHVKELSYPIILTSFNQKSSMYVYILINPNQQNFIEVVQILVVIKLYRITAWQNEQALISFFKKICCKSESYRMYMFADGLNRLRPCLHVKLCLCWDQTRSFPNSICVDLSQNSRKEGCALCMHIA